MKKLCLVLALLLVFLSGCASKTETVSSLDSLAGDWVIEPEATTSNLKNYDDIYTMFGSGLREFGAELKITKEADKTLLSGFIGAAFFCEGELIEDESGIHFTGKDAFDENLSFDLKTENDELSLISFPVFDETVYWAKRN